MQDRYKTERKVDNVQDLLLLVSLISRLTKKTLLAILLHLNFSLLPNSLQRSDYVFVE